MKRGVVHLVTMVVLTGLLSACKPGVPSRYIQPDEMEDLLYDYYIGQNMAYDHDDSEGIDYQRELIYQAVLKKHGVTQAEFDSSLVYYYTRADRFVKIYDRVQKRLNDQASELGAPVSEVERYMSLSQTGDTMDIWNGKRHLMLFPQAPCHVMQFALKADSSFHRGDSFMLSYNASFLVQSGSKSMTAYLSVIYENDSVAFQQQTFSSQGRSSVRIPACDKNVKEIKGFFYMPPRQSTDQTNDMCLLFIDYIQLIRFHHQQSSHQTMPNNDKDVEGQSDTLKHDVDTIERRARKLGERSISLNRKNEPVKTDLKPITRK